jgi:hypothetical protein
MKGAVNEDLDNLSKDFKDLSVEKRTEVLKTAKNLLNIQRINRAMIEKEEGSGVLLMPERKRQGEKV